MISGVILHNIAASGVKLYCIIEQTVDAQLSRVEDVAESIKDSATS